ncbi:MAG: CDP-diacylglycerol--serine O-phosphatidyltransferase [Bacteroides sp.]|nr:CDP-diacylglycerol--serine O-phosphatidyltransferase [Roseburia sp.]MCM1347542.1 CDP-diacylglycerol--serine O-phosphatidyltransferase [Bacteroides sp.]MCM1421983.1 CDP-diacylglycerol--serine O-phosphatidyltransferase [Bacteroides sp.]
MSTLVRNIPNIITCCNLICGCIATGAAFHHNFTTSFIFILLGAMFDFFDGMTARALGVSGKLGIELDSLADIVTFGVAPSAMVFTLFTEVRYPELIYNSFWFTVMPFTAFIMAAFSAMRLAKFNIDERQHTTFIGMPTPANAIFWAALISSSEAYLTSPMFNAPFLLAFVIMFSWLLVCEIPMFALKFKSMAWTANKRKYVFLILCALILGISASAGTVCGQTFRFLSRGIAGCIGLYLFMSIIFSYTRHDEQ